MTAPVRRTSRSTSTCSRSAPTRPRTARRRTAAAAPPSRRRATSTAASTTARSCGTAAGESGRRRQAAALVRRTDPRPPTGSWRASTPPPWDATVVPEVYSTDAGRVGSGGGRRTSARIARTGSTSDITQRRSGIACPRSSARDACTIAPTGAACDPYQRSSSTVLRALRLTAIAPTSGHGRPGAHDVRAVVSEDHRPGRRRTSPRR